MIENKAGKQISDNAYSTGSEVQSSYKKMNTSSARNPHQFHGHCKRNVGKLAQWSPRLIGLLGRIPSYQKKIQIQCITMCIRLGSWAYNQNFP